MSANKSEDLSFKILNKTRGYNGFFKVDEVHYQFSQYQGGWSPAITREVFSRGEAVVVLLFDSQKQRVILVEQCRAGALNNSLAQNESAWLLEPVAGMIDEGETALEACHRESNEEAGVKDAHFEFIYRYYPSPGACEEVLHLYAADIDSQYLPNFAGLACEAEDIKIVRLSFTEAKQRLLAGQFNVASTIIALQWLFFQKLA